MLVSAVGLGWVCIYLSLYYSEKTTLILLIAASVSLLVEEQCYHDGSS
jgi:hypothetical protein